MRRRRTQVVIAIAALAVVIVAQIWIRWSSILPESTVMLGFALVCILLSWLIDTLKTYRQRSKHHAPVMASSKSVSYTLPLVHHGGPQLVAAGITRNVTNAFTIDLEDYFHTEVSSRTISYEQWDTMPARIEFSTMRLLDLLEENQTKSTVFVLGWIARKYPRLIREVARRGHEIGCHSFQHRPISQLRPNVFYADTLLAKNTIEDVTGKALSGYRAPNFSLTPGTEWAPSILAELGFKYDSSVNPVRHPLYGNPDAPRHPYKLSNSGLLEIPIATWRVVRTNLPIGGGAYLRLLPYHYIRTGLNVMNSSERRPATIYVHPWEIDNYQPILPQTWTSHIRQTWGTAYMEGKLLRLLKAFSFAPICEVYAKELEPIQVEATVTSRRAKTLIEVSS